MAKDDKLIWFIALVIAVFVVYPLGVAIDTYTLDYLWDRLIRKQYGEGPTLRSWFGISLVVSFLLIQLQRDLRWMKNIEGPVARAFGLLVGNVLAALVILGSAVLVAAMAGW